MIIPDIKELRKMPTIHVGNDSDLKIETNSVRVWLSRMGPEDGETEPIQVEVLQDGKWCKIS